MVNRPLSCPASQHPSIEGDRDTVAVINIERRATLKMGEPMNSSKGVLTL
jgi:hypothetical protein